MKVSKTQTNPQQVSFKGMKKSKDLKGRESYKFFLPYDEKQYKCSVEFAEVDKNGKLNWEKLDDADIHTVELKNNQASIDPLDYFYDKKSNFGYRFRLEEKNGNAKFYHTDHGVAASGGMGAKYTVIDRERAAHNKPGQIVHLMPDNYNPGWFFDKNGAIALDKAKQKEALKASRTHFNQMGGNIAGIVQRIPEMKKAGVKNVLSTPLIGKDELSSHGYWTTNPLQMSSQFGEMKDLKKLQVELFKNDMNLIFDGAFVNEGLEGINFKDVLKWGDKSPKSTWFKNHGPLTLGVIPNLDKDDPTLKNFKLRVVNAPDSLKKKADGITCTEGKYDPTQPTHVQIYDTRLVSEKKAKSNEILRGPELLNTADHHEIMNHNDSVIAYAPEIQPKQLAKNLKNNAPLYKDEKDSIGYMKSLLGFDNFAVGSKRDGGFYTWDGNIDIAKLNYFYSNQDEAVLSQRGLDKEQKQAIKEGGHQVQDYIQGVGAYWTREAKNNLIDHTITQLKGKTGNSSEEYANSIKNSGGLPETAKKRMTKEVIQNILDNKYSFVENKKPAKKQEFVVRNLMKFPLETVEFSPDLTSTLSSQFITKRAFKKEDIGKDKIDLNDYSKMPERFRKNCKKVDDELYNKRMYYLADDVIEQFNRRTALKLIDDKGNVTEAGKFVVPMITSDIARFGTVKALAPDAVTCDNNKGEVKYDLAKMRKTGIKKVLKGKTVDSPDREAELVSKKLIKGVYGINEADTEALTKSIMKKFEGVTLEDVKIAHALVDRSEAGLNWRTDATKDVIDIDHIRNGNDNFQTEFDKAIDFWKGFTKGVRKENPNSYIIAEMTDLGDFYPKDYNGDKYKYVWSGDAEKKFIQETKMSTLSNYNYLYSSLPRMESENADVNPGMRSAQTMDAALELGDNSKIKQFLESSMVNASNHSHNFSANHDKPRLGHFFSLDMEIYHRAKVGDEGLINRYAYGDNKEKYEKAGKVIEDGLVNPKAVATAKRFEAAFEKSAKDIGIYSEDLKSKYLDSMSALVRGDDPAGKNNSDRARFNRSESFGTKGFDKTIKDSLDIAVKRKFLSQENADKIEAKMFEKIGVPSTKKIQRVAKLMSIMPGNPTLYAGDELFETGFETPNKNILVQNRNAIDWSRKDSVPFVKEHYDAMQDIQAVRDRKDLSALSTGETFECSTGRQDTIALLRYDDKSTLLCLGTDDGSVPKQKELDGNLISRENYIYHEPKQPNIEVNRVTFDIPGGVKKGSTFVDALDKNLMEYLDSKTPKGEKPLSMDKLTKEMWDEVKGKVKHHVVDQDKESKKFFIENVKMDDVRLVLKQIHFAGNKNKDTSLKVQAYLGSYAVDNRPTVAVY